MKKTETHGRLSAYPFRWEGLENFSYPRDRDGLPLVDMGKSTGMVYNPITISQYGLFNLQHSRSSSDTAFEQARICAGWLQSNFREEWRENSPVGAWVYDFDLHFYGPKAPWISGMAQAQGISLLLRVHQVEPLQQLEQITRKAFESFLHPVSSGGVVDGFPDGSLLFEEFPTELPSRVLNGHIFGLLGIFDYAKFWQDKSAQDLFDVAIAGLKRNLNLYDTGYWNLYDLHPSRRLASPMYINVHVQLLEILSRITGEGYFLDVSRKWRSYLQNPLCRLRWLGGKTIEKIRLSL